MKEAAVSLTWKMSGGVILSLKAAGSEQNQTATQSQKGWSRAKELWKGNFRDLCADTLMKAKAGAPHHDHKCAALTMPAKGLSSSFF